MSYFDLSWLGGGAVLVVLAVLFLVNAIRIFRETGWRHPVIAEMSELDMQMWERIAPWQPRKKVAA